MFKTIEFVDGVVRMIDQTRLPTEKTYIDCRTIKDVEEAIRSGAAKEVSREMSKRKKTPGVFLIEKSPKKK